MQDEAELSCRLTLHNAEVLGWSRIFQFVSFIKLCFLELNSLALDSRLRKTVRSGQMDPNSKLDAHRMFIGDSALTYTKRRAGTLPDTG